MNHATCPTVGVDTIGHRNSRNAYAMAMLLKDREISKSSRNQLVIPSFSRYAPHGTYRPAYSVTGLACSLIHAYLRHAKTSRDEGS